MLTHIGTSRPSEEPVDLLLECHSRIQAFTELTRRLAEATSPAPDEVREAAERVRRYFAEALPLHARDEEESVLPRLAGKDRDVDAVLVRMHADHGSHGPLLGRVTALCEVLVRAPERHAELAGALGDAAAALREHFVGHLSVEEAVVFPAIDRLLTEEARREIVLELRARRRPADLRVDEADAPGAVARHSSR
jgi:iron-sulfur cluster repair protein YtfE (RIC family)